MSDDQDLTPLSLPTTLPYPITLTRLHAAPDQPISRGSPLLSYTFTSSTNTRELVRLQRGQAPSEGIRREDVREGDMSATWESGIEGDFVRWEDGIEVGRVVERRHASRPVVWMKQPCTHPVQIHGLCGICGADLTSEDYLSSPPAPQAGPSRHGGFEMSHDAMGVTVSSNEAKRLDSLTRDSLLANRKLSLIVDLDQTIIHTTVDPTVGDWMAEIEEDERSVGSSSEVGEARTTTTPPGSPVRPTKRKREANPNATALRDVARFTLEDDPPVPGQGRRVKQPERWYYTKPRPGLQHFLDTMSEYYEMHVYTMGTRTYADAICKVIDPEGKTFGDRILSRDESGNFTSKSLKRLFPTDTSMVVVIDDRQDVWGDCPNLVKVVPYDFFIGIGDINSSFLPPTPKSPPTTPPPGFGSGSGSSSPTSASTGPPMTPPEESEATSEEDGLLLQKKLMDDVSEARPLAKLQEALEEESSEIAETETTRTRTETGNSNSTAETTETVTDESGEAIFESDSSPASSDSEESQARRKPVLNNEDHELDRLAKILGQIHQTFYEAFDARRTGPLYPLPLGCDVELIVPEMKASVLQGCHLIFSGMINRAERPESTILWQTAEMFGAIPSLSLTSKITHCVTATLGTEKTYRAANLGVPVVWEGWFWQSINLWQRQPEGPWIAIRLPQGSKGNGQPTPGPSTPTTPALPDAPLQSDSEQGGGSSGDTAPAQSEKLDQREGDVDEEQDEFAGDEGFGEGWDDDAQAELDAFLEGSSDFGSEGGDSETRSERSREGTPGTPSKKRVRYADEEQLPLESFKDPSPNHIPSPPKKRSKPLLLEAPGADDQISEDNKFVYRAPGGYKSAEAAAPDTEQQDEGEDAEAADATEGDGDDDDDFARMLREEMDE